LQPVQPLQVVEPLQVVQVVQVDLTRQELAARDVPLLILRLMLVTD
jgi:hypothetical protein